MKKILLIVDVWEYGDSHSETSDIFDVDDNISLKDFVNNFDTTHRNYWNYDFHEILSAHMISESYSPCLEE